MHIEARGEELSESVTFCYHARRVQNRHNYAHDVLSYDDMKQFAEVVLERGRHDVILCFRLENRKQ